MSRQRTQRRAQQQAEQQRQTRASRERRIARQRQRRQAKGGPAGRGRTGWAGMRRSRGQRITIGVVAVLGVALIWLLADWPLAIALTVLWLLALPAFVVLTTGRRY